MFEGTAILTSILLAFAIDAWSDRVQQQKEEHSILQGLRVDFQQTLDVIARDRAAMQNTALAAEELISFSGSDTDILPGGRSDTLLAALIVGDRFVPIDATFNALLNSEGLEIISKPHLRTSLAGWPRQMVLLRRNEEGYEALIRQHFMPYLYERLPVRTLDQISMPETRDLPSGFSGHSNELLSDLKFENLVNDVLFYARTRDEDLLRVKEFTEEILSLINAELKD